MLFKLFTLFSMITLTQGASVREIGPSYVTRRHHHYGGSIGGGGSGGWGGSSGGGGSGGCGGWQDLLSGQTVTVTVTETPVYSTSTDEPSVTDDTVSTTDGESSGGDDSTDLNSQEHCLFLFNEFRKSLNLPLFESATQEQIDCANKAAVYDAQAGYHASFYNQMCNLGGQGGSPASQCECMKNTGFDLPTADPNDPLKTCLNAYIAEETLGAYPQLNKGHYRVITGDFKYLACGTDDNGFYTHNFYN